LIFYGIVLVMPIAPVPMFGVAQVLSHGHFVTTILIAMVAMMLTAVSYGRMATLFPTAGLRLHLRRARPQPPFRLPRGLVHVS
jgi:amino acid transporter